MSPGEHAVDILRTRKLLSRERPRLMPSHLLDKMRSLGPDVAQGRYRIREYHLLDERLPLALGELYLLPHLQPEEYAPVFNYPVMPAYDAHHFVCGSTLLVVSADEALQDHLIEYLFDITVEIELYVDDYVGQEPFPEGIARLTGYLRDQLLELIELPNLN